MRTILAILAAAALMMAASTALATPIQGVISFGGSVSYTGGSTAATATGIHFERAYTDQYGSTGIYAAINDFTIVQYNDFTFNPYSDPLSPLWTLTDNGITYDFEMLTLSYTVNGSSLHIVGSGILGATGFDDTTGIWDFTTQDGAARISFSANSAPVPEPSAVVLLGAGLLSLGIYGRRRAKK